MQTTQRTKIILVLCGLVGYNIIKPLSTNKLRLVTPMNALTTTNKTLVTSREDKLSRLAESFLAGRKETTVQAYRQDLEEFRAFIGAASLEEAASRIASMEHGDANLCALDYRTHLKGQSKQSATINRRLASLRSLVKFASTLGLVDWSLDIKNEKAEAYRDTTGISPEAFKRLLAKTTAQKNAQKAARDVALLRLMFDLGLRRAEVLGLNVEDYDAETRTISILGKGRTQKQKLTLSPQSEAALREWIGVRGSHEGAIFTDFDKARKSPGRLTMVGLTLVIRDLGAKVGIKLSPHKLRHSAITQACKLAQANGIDIEEVLDFSRHKDVRTLLIYRDRERNVQGSLAALVGATV